MPRPTQGHVVERPWADGETISYGAQVRAYGRYEWVTFGTNTQGWNRTRAELEVERIVQQIERGTWVPPRLLPREDRLDEAMAALGVQIDETFRVSLSGGGAQSNWTWPRRRSWTTAGGSPTWSASSGAIG